MLYTLGELRLGDVDFQRPKTLLLLAYLVLESKQERCHLAELFWPGLDNGLENLSMILSRLKKALPDSFEADERYVKANLDADALLLIEAFEKQRWPRVLELYQGSFLAAVQLKG